MTNREQLHQIVREAGIEVSIRYTAHDAVSRGELVDLGYREQQQSRLLTQTFECREKGSK